MSIGSRIKNARIKKGLSQEDVAKAIGSTKQAVYKYETGIVTNIPTDKLETMATLLEVSPAYLMGWDGLQKEPTALTDGELEEDVIIFHRDGKTQKRKFTKEQMAMFMAMVDAIPETQEEP